MKSAILVALLALSCKVDEQYELSKEEACQEQAVAFCRAAADQECESDLCAGDAGGAPYAAQCSTDDSMITLQQQQDCLDEIEGMEGCSAPPFECRNWW